LIYASSEIINQKERTQYKLLKLESIDIINKLSNDNFIFNIPRVYSSDREKGLIKILKDDKFNGNFDQQIKYIDIENFLFNIKNILNKKEIIFDYHINKIKTIKEKYAI